MSGFNGNLMAPASGGAAAGLSAWLHSLWPVAGESSRGRGSAQDRVGQHRRYQRASHRQEGHSGGDTAVRHRSEEHTSEPKSLMRISYAVSLLKNNIYSISLKL